ncbi:unnamed protein product [Rodentolepis nana]|uniref:LRRCT domain-containing protein n=1 Tax=Rodentolepis nana TaxID=102285 RepID=A0A0R3TBJ7_RODNA|nr:unnamed protein product [Rodentolepis nana]
MMLLFLLFALVGRGDALCSSGCYCPSDEIAHCCLFPPDFPSPVQCSIPGRRQISANANLTLRWPVMDTCLARWTDLSVQLEPGSWPPPRPRRPCTALLRRITISGGGLIVLKAQHFQTLFGNQENQLKSITIENTNLENLEQGLFDRLSLKSLTEIHIRENPNLGYKGFGVSVFSSLPQLETLDLKGNRIEHLDFVRWGFPVIDKGKPPSRLINLNLANNSLTFIKSGTFVLFPFLESLSLANNRLSSLSSDVFEGLFSLKQLDLSGNLLNLMELKNMPAFSITLANLNILDISMNPLMRSIYTENVKWWLSSGCPASLTHLFMNFIEVDQGQDYPILPPIDWSKCAKLAQVNIQQIPRLPCLPSSWLRSDVFPASPEFVTSASKVCPPITTPSIKTTISPIIASTLPSLAINATTKPLPSYPTGVRELIVSSVVGGVLFILLIFLIITVFLCRRRRWMYGPVGKENGKPGRISIGSLNSGLCQRPLIASTYIPASPDCPLPISDGDCDDGDLSASSMRPSESRILYDESGIPVCSMVVPEPGSPTVVMLPDGTLALTPQFIPFSGRATPSSHTGLLDNSNYRNSRLFLKHPFMVPLMTSHNSLANSQIDFLQKQSHSQHLGKTRSRLHQQNGGAGTVRNQPPNSSLSCKSTSFSSLGGSVHSEIHPLSSSVFRASPPPLDQLPQTKSPSSPSNASIEDEEPSLMVETTAVTTMASTSMSAANPLNSQSDETAS